MGQLINRISRYLKSETGKNEEKDYEYASTISFNDDSDEELKKIIDELNNNKDNEKKDNQSKRYKSQNNDNNPFSLDNAFATLNLKSNATIDEIKSAYKLKVKEYHPDRVANLGDELKSVAEKKTQEINIAYEMIKKYKGMN